MQPLILVLLVLATAALGWLLLRLEGTLRLLDRTSSGLGTQMGQGLQQANTTFADVLQRLAVIDEAQRNLQALTREVVGLEALLGDKRARGAFGEVQLESLVQNVLPPAFYRFQHTLSTGVRVDCLLTLPEPTGQLAVDAKFPLENYRRSIDPASTAEARAEGRKRLRADIKAHIDAIAGKYILPGETAGGAVMFIPAESLFAEIHGELADLVDYAQRRDVWIASPTTLFAILHTLAAVIKDARLRAEAEEIRVALGHLGTDFARFDQRLGNLERHYRQMGEDLESLRVSGRSLLKRFGQVSRGGLGEGDDPRPPGGP